MSVLRNRRQRRAQVRDVDDDGPPRPLWERSVCPSLAETSWLANRVRGMRQRVQVRLRGFARAMRVEATDAEGRMWARLRDGRLDGLKFRRQVPIGNAIVDFICYERRLIVEVDGGQHGDTADAGRDAVLQRRGFIVLRFWNHDVLKNTDEVLDVSRRRRGKRRLVRRDPLTLRL